MRFEKVKNAPAGVKLPTRSTEKSAGYDFYSPADYEIKPGETVKIHTGIKAKMDDGVLLLVVVRSSIGIKRNLRLSNTIGIIDSDYYGNPDNDGDIIVAMYNYGKETKYIKKGERFAQGVFLTFAVTDDDTVSGSRTGGIGSTGK